MTKLQTNLPGFFKENLEGLAKCWKIYGRRSSLLTLARYSEEVYSCCRSQTALSCFIASCPRKCAAMSPTQTREMKISHLLEKIFLSFHPSKLPHTWILHLKHSSKFNKLDRVAYLREILWSTREERILYPPNIKGVMNTLKG